MGLDTGGFLSDLARHRFLGLAEALEEVFFAALDSPVEVAPGSAPKQLDQVLRLKQKYALKQITSIILSRYNHMLVIMRLY